MDVRIARWGNSLAVRIPKAVAEGAALREGDRVTVDVAEDGSVTLQPVSRPYGLQELVDGITPENRHEETGWGEARGGEAW
jgi:antitoxin MazE